MKPSEFPIGTVGIFEFMDESFRLWTIQAIYPDGQILISGPQKTFNIIDGEKLRYEGIDFVSKAVVFKEVDDFDLGL